MWRILASVVVCTLFVLELSALSNEEDTRYLLLKKTSLARNVSLIETRSVRNELSCAAHCNINSGCTHFAVDRNDRTVCHLYSEIEGSYITAENGTNSYMRLNPHGTVASEYLPVLDPTVPFLDDAILWRQSTNNDNRNLILSGVRHVQSCYEVCVSFTADDCWVFSYIESEGRCVVPNLDGEQLVYQTRNSLITETVGGSATYAFTRVKVDETYGQLISGSSHYNMGDNYIYKGSSPTDTASNLIIPGIDNEQYCYRICLVTNSGTCTLFSYSDELHTCVVPHGSGGALFRTMLNAENEQFYSVVFDGAYPERLENQTYITMTDSVLHLGTAIDDLTHNRYLRIVNTMQDCYTSCLVANDGNCLTFSFSPINLTCVVPHNYGSLEMEDLIQEVEPGFDTIVFVAGHTDPLLNESYITLTNVVSYQGESSEDTDYNRNMAGSTSRQDCYTKCLKTNNGYCFEFSYSPSTSTCIVPHDDGTLPIDSFGQEIQYGFNITLFPVHFGYQLSNRNFITLSNVTYHKGSDVIDLSNYMVFGVESPQDCYIICLDRNDGHCLSISYAEEFKTCTLPHADGNTHIDDTKNSVAEGYQTIYFTDYLADNNSITNMSYITLENVIYYKGNFTGIENFVSVGVDTEQDCYSLCLSRNGGNCFSFSYDVENGVCFVTEDDGTTVLDDVSIAPTDGFETVYFTNSSGTPLPKPNYITFADVIYYRGFERDDKTLNFISAGVSTLQNCYALCLSRNGGTCFSISYHSGNLTCRVPHDDGSTAIQDLSYEVESGFETLLFSDLINHTLSTRQYITLAELNIATSTIFQTNGPTSLQDCYVTCLIRNSERCFSFSYTNETNLCSFPLDDGNLNLDYISKYYAAGLITILFTEYSNATLPYPYYLNLTGVVPFAGSSRMNANFNYFTYGLTSAQDCYALCLERNDGYCITYSYDPASYNCRFPKGERIPTVATMKTLEDSRYEAVLVNQYATANLSNVNTVALTDVTFTTSSDYSINGPNSADDCYAVCLLRNSDKCFSFSYNSEDRKCYFPVEDGSVVMDDVTPVVESGVVTYVLTDYSATNLPSPNYITLQNVILYGGSDRSDTNFNFYTYGVTSEQNCYALCLHYNTGHCYAFSYSINRSECHLPTADTNTGIADVPYMYFDSFNTTLTTAYTSSLLSGVNYVTLTNTKYSEETNFEMLGTTSRQDCYTICLERNGDKCFSISYNLETTMCTFPLEDGTQHLDNMNKTVENGTDTLVFTDYVVGTNPLSGDPHTVLVGIIYFTTALDDPANFLSIGVQSEQDCYTLCLARNGGSCFSFSYTNASNECFLPHDGNSIVLKYIGKRASTGTLTFVFSAHADTSVPSSHILEDVIYYVGSSKQNANFNFYTGGVTSEQSCYALCLNYNEGNCLSFSYSSSDEYCRCPRYYTGGDTLEELKYQQVVGYNSSVMTAYSSASLESQSYFVITDMIYWEGTNFEILGAATRQSCYILCLMRNGNKCFSFSHSVSTSSCSLPLEDGSLEFGDISITGSSGYDTVLFTDYASNNPLSSEYSVTLSRVGLHLGSAVGNRNFNFFTNGITTTQDCYTLCLVKLGGTCKFFSYKVSSKTCTIPLHSASTLINDLGQQSLGTYVAVFIASSYQTQLDSTDHITFTGFIYHLGTGSADTAENWRLNGVTSSQDCFTSCLLYNSGNCDIYSYSSNDKRCIIPNYSSSLTIGDYGQESDTNYITVISNTDYTDQLTSTDHITYNGTIYHLGTGSADTDENWQLNGVTSSQDCFTSCLLYNSGNCDIYSYSSNDKRCIIPNYSSSLTIGDYGQESDTNYITVISNTGYTALLPNNYIALSGVKWSKSRSRDNKELGGAQSAQDCYTGCLMENGGNCFSFSFADTTRTCFFPLAAANTVIADVLESVDPDFNTYMPVAAAYNLDIASQTYFSLTDRVLYYGASYTDPDTYQMSGVGSSADCFKLALMQNTGDKIAYSYSSNDTMCYVPKYSSGDYNIGSLGESEVYGATAVVFKDVHTATVPAHLTITNMIYHKGSDYTATASNYKITGVASSQDCYTACLMRNDGACNAFSYSSGTCYAPVGATFSVLQSTDVTSYTTYVMTGTTPGMPVSYSALPDQYMYLGTGMDDRVNNVYLDNKVSSLENCYKVCYLTYGSNCVAFTWGLNVCSIPSQNAISYLSDIKMESNSSYSSYFLFVSSSRVDAFVSTLYSSVSNLRIRDGRTASNREMTFSGVTDLVSCYRLCLETMASCATFSYDPSADYCYLTTADFHTDWTYVDSISGCTGYFLKDLTAWKLITKHLQYEGVMPDDAYNHVGNYHQTVPAGDLDASGSYTTNVYLKNQMIDFWGDLSSRSKLRMELRSSAGSLRKYLEFNAGSTTKTNWFSSTYLSASSWADLPTIGVDVFEIADSGRTFYISHDSNWGCTSDKGWLQITATANFSCTEWDRSATVPMFLYANSNTFINWSTDKANFDVLLVYMSFN